MDGVIINSEHLWEKTEKKLLKLKDLEYDDNYRHKIIGLNQEDSALLLKEHFGLKDSVEFIIETRIRILLELYEMQLNMNPGIEELITRLYNNAIPLAVASSSPLRVIEFVLKKFDLKKFMKVIVSGDCVKKGKPGPDIYLTTSRRLSIPPEECIVIEDSINGVRSAKQAGMYCIAVPDKRLSLKEFNAADEIEKNTLSLLKNRTINANIFNFLPEGP